MEEGMMGENQEDTRDPFPDYKFLESVMEVSQDPQKIIDLSNERLLLLLHMMCLGLHYRGTKNLDFNLDPELEEFLINVCSDSLENLEKGREIISSITPTNNDFYKNIMNMVDFMIVEFLKTTSNLDDSHVSPGELKLVEQLFSSLEDPDELSKLSDSQFLLLVQLLVSGEYLNEINSLGFYLSEDITRLLRKFNPSKKQFENLKTVLGQLIESENENVYENFSALVNFIIYNFLKGKL